MHSQRRWLSGVCLAMACLTACSGTTVTPAPTPDAGENSWVTNPVEKAPLVVTLSYSRSDSLNPFKAASRVNRELCDLLYEGLTVTDATMHAQNRLAESVSVSADRQTVTAVLRTDAVFSDGAAVTSEDVVASFEAAKASDAYASLLRAVESAETVKNDSRTVVFTMSEPDPYVESCLSFPVVRVAKDGSVLGSGAYVFDPAPRLVPNPQTTVATVSEIRLLDLVDDDEMTKGLELGNITYFFSDLSGGTIPRVSSATAAIPMNYLVFLGVNTRGDKLSDAGLRQAVSLALDRSRLSESGFAGYATAAATTFPSAFTGEETLAGFAGGADRVAAMSRLTAAGFTTPDTVVTTGKGRAPKPKTLSLSLLVNGDNGFKSAMAMLVKEQLESVGIAVSVQSVGFEDYKTALSRGSFDLYIGEVRLTVNMDLSPLLAQDGAVSFGIASENTAVTQYAAFRAGTVSLAEFCDTFAAELPYIPVCWRSGMAAFSRSLTNVNPSAFHVYAGLENWTVN